METIGKRIQKHRLIKGWSRPELGRKAAEAIGRKRSFSGESIRRYEEGVDRPGKDARRALALVFGKSESYIEFGDDPAQSDPLLSQLLDLYGKLGQDGRDTLLGNANRIYAQEHPARSAANPFPSAKHPGIKPTKRAKE